MNYITIKKIVIFGAEGSGKTSLTSRFENKYFVEEIHSEKGKIIF